jgi:hypothetical protein
MDLSEYSVKYGGRHKGVRRSQDGHHIIGSLKMLIGYQKEGWMKRERN